MKEMNDSVDKLAQSKLENAGLLLGSIAMALLLVVLVYLRMR